jgi:hypothetical protein
MPKTNRHGACDARLNVRITKPPRPLGPRLNASEADPSAWSREQPTSPQSNFKSAIFCSAFSTSHFLDQGQPFGLVITLAYVLH